MLNSKFGATSGLEINLSSANAMTGFKQHNVGEEVNIMGHKKDSKKLIPGDAAIIMSAVAAIIITIAKATGCLT